MLAAHCYAHRLDRQGRLPRVKQLRVELFGVLGATERGHGTDKAVLFAIRRRGRFLL
jgi:L-serine dehydratase